MTAAAQPGAVDIEQMRRLLYLEARHIDAQNWGPWLDLYEPDARFWAPTWRDETTLTDDPDRELSLMYLVGRQALEERVARIASGRSIASVRRRAHTHCLSNIELDGWRGARLLVRSTMATFTYNLRSKSTSVLHGRYEHLVTPGPAPRIAAKTVVLMNDYLPAFVDINTL